MVLEFGLANYAVKYMLSNKYSIDQSNVQLIEKVNELVASLKHRSPSL